VHILNGFAYGIVYNLILGFILQKTFKTQKSSPMGVYQSVLSIGITLSTLFTTWMKDKPLAEKDYTTYFRAADIIN
jgi:cyanate permease